ncbi:hypothetical protein N7540_007064 [Penicillium herquei]|nr:hypothetical protein N7540_007064 [Penicillium herquei]
MADVSGAGASGGPPKSEAYTRAREAGEKRKRKRRAEDAGSEKPKMETHRETQNEDFVKVKAAKGADNVAPEQTAEA